MSETTTSSKFRTVRRGGYEPAHVDQEVRRLNEAVDAARRQTVDMARRVEELEAALNTARKDSKPSEPSFAEFGQRIGKILALAEEEAADLRTEAAAEVDKTKQEAKRAAVDIRKEAERYATDKRGAANAEAEQIIADSKRKGTELREEAARDAAARREEAEAIYEDQKAKAAQAATELEKTLASRREQAEQDLVERTAAAEQHLAAVLERAEQTQAEADRNLSEATSKASRMVDEAERKAHEIVSEAKSRAERIRAESERELAATTARRDSINAQLSNLRQMLATLSGATTDPSLLGIVPEGGDDKK